ncbi:MAG: peptidase S10 [Candidatus Aminicenantales bacterium]
MSRRNVIVCAAGLILLMGIVGPILSARPSQQPPPPEKKAAGPAPGTATTLGTQPAPQPAPADKPFAVTRHTVTIGGKPIGYTATAGTLTVNKPDEKAGARMYFTAYTVDGVREIAARPITFLFNGGPGSSSVWLHLGGLGPRRVVMNAEGYAAKAPFGLTDSENSLLDVTDMVFIDPVMTGYSRPLPGENKAQFTGVGEDLASVGEFIRLFITRFERWASPKFILGESYGTTRAAGLSGFLQGRSNGMYLNGIVLVSSVLDFQTIMFQPGSNLSYVLYLPHYTATAWFHKKLAPALEARPLKDVVAEAEEFAANAYSLALFKGNRLSKEEAGAVAEKVAAYTGLSKGYVLESNLRIRHDRFVKELLRTDFETVGRLDSRFKGRDADAAGETYDYDPASAVIGGAFPTMFNNYLRTELQYKEDLPYAVYGNVYPWNFMSSPGDQGPGPGGGRGGFGGLTLNVAEILQSAMRENPGLQVFVANGYYDGATPFFGTEYTFSQIGLNKEFEGRVRFGYYEAGHMMYIHKPSLVKLKSDLAEFIKSAAGK